MGNFRLLYSKGVMKDIDRVGRAYLQVAHYLQQQQAWCTCCSTTKNTCTTKYVENCGNAADGSSKGLIKVVDWLNNHK